MIPCGRGESVRRIVRSRHSRIESADAIESESFRLGVAKEKIAAFDVPSEDR